jgi:hypothetical protein
MKLIGMKLGVALFLAAVASAQERYVWSGVRIQGGKREGKAVSAMSEAEVREAKRADPASALAKELAEIRLLADVDRKVEEASKRLEDLRIRAAWELDYPRRFDVLVLVAKERAEIFAKLGRSEDAAKAVQLLLPDAAAKQAAPTYELVPASAKLIQEEQLALKDPRLVAGTRAVPASSQPSDEIEAAVVKAFQERQYKVVEDIGSRAAPALEKLALAKVDELVETSAEPLWFLFRLAPDRGAKFALESYDRGGFFWHKRILNSMRAQSAKENDMPAWAAVTARLIDDPQVRRDALVLVHDFAQRNWFTPELQAAMVRALEGADSDLATEILRVLTDGFGRSSVQPVIEAMVQSPIVEVRRTAASWMRGYASSETMLRLVDHQDPEMRGLLASFLTPATPNQPRHVIPVIDSRARDILAKLALDPEPSVRADAAAAIAELKTPLDADVYTALARDTDAKVLDTFDWVLGKLAQSQAGVPPWYLSLLARRRANSTARMGAKWNDGDLSSLLRPVLQTKAGAQTATEWALEDGDDRTFRTVAGLVAQPTDSKDVAAWTSGDRGGVPALDDPTLERVYRRSFTVSRDDVFSHLQGVLLIQRWGGKAAHGGDAPDRAGRDGAAGSCARSRPRSHRRTRASTSARSPPSSSTLAGPSRR